MRSKIKKRETAIYIRSKEAAAKRRYAAKMLSYGASLLHAMTNQKQPPGGSSSATMASEINVLVNTNKENTKQLIELFQGHESLLNTTSRRYHWCARRMATMTITIAMIASEG